MMAMAPANGCRDGFERPPNIEIAWISGIAEARGYAAGRVLVRQRFSTSSTV